MHWCASLLLLFVFFEGQIKTQAFPFDTIVSFGDSNTDTGNVYNITNRTWPIAPPYFQGRFSNGPVWIEKLGVSNVKNYAYGGATSDTTLIQGFTASNTIRVPGIYQQILSYFNETKLDFTRTLYVVWGGPNDYFFDQTLSPSRVVDSLLNGVQLLLRRGVKHLLIINQPPLQTIPWIQTQEQVLYFTELTTSHNRNLSLGISKLDYDHQEVSLYLFDIYSFILKIMANNSQYPFNIKDSCWNEVNGIVTTLCSNPELYFYIDQFHFTTRIHQLIADAVRQFISSSSSKVLKLSYSVQAIFSAFTFLVFVY